MQLLVTEESVDKYLDDHGLQYGAIPIQAALLQLEGTLGGHPAVMFVVELNGQKTIAKLTLNTLIAITGALRASAESHGWKQPA